MRDFFIYDSNGRIHQCGACPDADYDLQTAPEGMRVGEGLIDPDAYYIDSNGAAVEIPPRPGGPHYVFDYETKQWSDPRPLAALKAAKNAEINLARMAANRGTFTYGGHFIACDELSRSDIDGVNGAVSLLGSLPDNWVGAWKTADNSFVAIPDLTAWTQFYCAMVQQGQINFAHAQQLKAALAAATTAEEVAAITWQSAN